MKKIICIVLSLIMCFGIVGCGEDKYEKFHQIPTSIDNTYWCMNKEDVIKVSN